MHIWNFSVAYVAFFYYFCNLIYIPCQDRQLFLYTHVAPGNKYVKLKKLYRHESL